MRSARFLAAALVATAAAGTSAGAQFTYNSPTGSPLPSTVSAVGGIVVDLRGANGNRVVAQRAASGLFIGDAPALPVFSIGVQTGFTSALLGQLGGGLTSAAFRISLFDGDTRSGNFDFNDNFLRVNGTRVGNFSAVQTIQTNGTGTPAGSGNIANGFGDGILNTGFFFVNDATTLSAIFSSLLSTGQIDYGYEDIDSPGEQYLDFTQGLDQSVIDVGQGPVVTPPTNVVPEPGTVVLTLTGLAAMAAAAGRRARA